MSTTFSLEERNDWKTFLLASRKFKEGDQAIFDKLTNKRVSPSDLSKLPEAEWGLWLAEAKIQGDDRAAILVALKQLQASPEAPAVQTISTVPDVANAGVAATLSALVMIQDPHIKINAHIVDRAIKRFSGQVQLSVIAKDPRLALNTYQEAERLPATYTEVELDSKYGYKLNGNLIRDNDNMIICFKDTTPYVLKILTYGEYKAMLALQPLLPPHNNIIPIKQLIQGSHGKAFAIMPILPTTLEGLLSLSSDSTLRFWQQMKSALESFHKIRYVHGDVKPANICLTPSGDFVLIDLGSAAPFGARVTSTTAYHPKLAKGSQLKFNIASPALDWWMLAAVVTERACNLNWGGISNPTPEQMCQALEKVENVWSELRVKLEL